MKKLLIASGVAVLALTSVVAAQTFSTNLTVGSTGSDVVALQTWLVANGFNIPAISSGAAAKGYFGSQTQSAVKLYQASKGIPNTGFVGPLTRAALNAGGAVVTVPAMGCPVGYTCTPTPGTVVTPVVTPGAPFVSDGTDGSITLSSSSYVSSSQTLKKGDMNKPIASITAQATNGNVQVGRFDVHFNTRPWLLFSSLTLKDAVTGQVLATKNLFGSADATEVTVGSDYLVRFDNVNAVVVPGRDTVFVVSANVLAASDKITGQTVTVTTDANGIRTINGKGYTDSTGLATTFSLVMSSTGSTGDLYTKIGNTPDTRTENVSTTNTTEKQTLGVFAVKLQNQSGKISQLNFTIQNSKNYSATTLFQNVQLYAGSTFLGGAYSLSSGGTATFVNMNIPLAVDQWVDLTLKADVLATSTAFTASSTIVSSSVVGVDDNFNTITLTNASNRTANDVTFVPNAGLTIGNWVINKGNVAYLQSGSGTWAAAYPTISFTINNTGSNPIYISKTASVALATSTTSGANGSTTVSSVTASGSTSQDTASSYVVNGSRTFTYNLTVDNTNGTTASKKISITQINYGTSGASDSVNNLLNVNYGLENAYVQVP
jgi:hypothetical protein